MQVPKGFMVFLWFIPKYVIVYGAEVSDLVCAVCYYSFFIGIENQPPQALPVVPSRAILLPASSRQIQGIYIVLMQSINIHIYYLFLTRWSWTNITCIFVFFGQLKNNINTNITKDRKHLHKFYVFFVIYTKICHCILGRGFRFSLCSCVNFVCVCYSLLMHVCFIGLLNINVCVGS
jgi:hypothetical protein